MYLVCPRKRETVTGFTNSIVDLEPLSFPVSGLHAGGTAEGHRGCQRGHQEVAVHAAAEEVGGQRWRQMQESRNHHISRRSRYTGTFLHTFI